MPLNNRTIDEMRPGDYVKTGYNQFEKIVSIDGHSRRKPSAGGFSVLTTSGNTISMFEARSYHKASDMLPGEIH